MLGGTVAVGWAAQQDAVQVGAVAGVGGLGATLLVTDPEFAHLLELAYRALHGTPVDVGVAGEGGQRRPRTSVALVVGDPEQHDLVGAEGAGMVQDDRH